MSSRFAAFVATCAVLVTAVGYGDDLRWLDVLFVLNVSAITISLFEKS